MHSSPSRRVHVYLNVSSRNMVTFSFCIFSNVVFFAYIMWNETLHIYLRWSPCIMVALSDESFQSKQFNSIKSPSTLNPNRNNKDMSSLTKQGIVALLSCRYHHRAISVLLIASLIFLSITAAAPSYTWARKGLKRAAVNPVNLKRR